MTRFYAQHATTGVWKHRDVPLSDLEVTWDLSGPGSLRATVTPEIASMKAGDGSPLLQPWGTLLYLEESNQVRWGGILVRSEFTGPDWTVEAEGFATYPRGIPYGGVYRRRRVDPFDAVREIWGHVQSQPDGDLGVVVDSLTTDVRLGRTETLLSKNLETGTDHTGTTQGFSSDDATLSSVTGRKHSGKRSLKCDMGASHTAGAEIFETHFASIDPNVSYSFYAWASTGGTEPNESFNVRVTARFFDQNRNQIGNQVSEDITNLPAGGEWTEARMEDFSTGRDNAAYVRLSVSSADGDDDAVSVWVDGVMLVEGQGRGQDYALVWWESPDCGAEIDRLAAEVPFDYREEHSWADESKETVTHRLRLGYPRIGRRKPNLRFVEGENVADVVAVIANGDDFANEVVGIGAGEGRDMLRARIPHRDGRLRRVHVAEDKSIRREQRLREMARAELRMRSPLTEITRCVVWEHPHAPLGSFDVGDDILVEARSGWADTSVWSRIVGYTYRPGTGVVELDLIRSDSFSYGAGA